MKDNLKKIGGQGMEPLFGRTVRNMLECGKIINAMGME